MKVAAPQQEQHSRELPPPPPHHVCVARSPAPPPSATERDPSDTGPSTLISNLCIAYRQTCERDVHKSHPDGYNTATCRGRCGDTERQLRVSFGEMHLLHLFGREDLKKYANEWFKLSECAIFWFLNPYPLQNPYNLPYIFGSDTPAFVHHP